MHANLHIYGMHCAWRNQQRAHHVHAYIDSLSHAYPNANFDVLSACSADQQFAFALHTHANPDALHNPQRGWAAC
jgi:hypothetical protein